MAEHPKGLMVEEYQAFVERIAWYSVGIVHARADVDHAQRRMSDAVGSGTACNWKGQRLILTADHVVANAEPDGLAFLLRVDDAIKWEGSGNSEKVVRRVPLPVERIIRCKEHDLAAIVLRSPELSNTRLQFCELPKQLMKRRTLRRKGVLILLGFPVDRQFTISEVRSANAFINYSAARPTILHATIASLPSKPLSSRYDPERDVLVDYKPYDPKMRPHGFSGSAAWCDRLRRGRALWAAQPMIFGVQTSAFMVPKLLQIVGAPTVNEFLETSF